MAFAVELFFDAATEAALRRLIDTTAGRDSSSSSYRPHVSLGGSKRLRDAPSLIHALETLASEQAGAFPVTLAHLGLFPGDEGVIFYGVTVTTPLLLLQRRFHALFTPLAIDWSPFYQPGSWVPHCTLAYGLPQDRLSDVIVKLQQQVPPSISGLLTSIALVHIPSGDERAVFAFEATGVTE
ncbi:MAG: 2'-5' RNA ligase family protein [Armatimonadota bacterium]